jgi:hypothetical protein
MMIGALAVAAPARADRTSWHVTASGDLAATDNTFSAPSSGDREADIFTQIRPGVLFAYDAPRMIHELSAELELLEYAFHSDNPSVTGHVGWLGFFLPGPRSELFLGANASDGQLNALTSRTSPDQTGLSVLPTSTQPIDVRQADASEYLSWMATKEVRTSQNAFARWTSTDDNLPMPTTTSVFEAGMNLGLERSFRSDSFALQGGASFLRLEDLAPPGTMPGSTLQRQINPRGSLVWRHDIDKRWSTNFDGGVVYVNPIASDPYNPTVQLRSALFPVFGGLLAYSEAWGRATIMARRQVTPDLFVALDTVTDSVTAQLSLPLPWLDDNPHARAPKLVGLASVGAERAQLLDPNTSQENGQIYLGHLDAGIGWTPRPGQTYGVRYELIYQHGDPNGAIPTQSFVRNTLFFTFSLRYPDRIAATIPRQTESVRADRKDLAPVGAEPVVPDPTEQQSDDEDSGGDNR